MKIGKIDRKMHKIKEYSLRELLFIPNNHFILISTFQSTN